MLLPHPGKAMGSFAFFAAILLLAVVSGPGNMSQFDYSMSIGVLALACLAMFLIACGFRTNLQIDSEGFTVRWLWKKHSYLWREVESFRPLRQQLRHGFSRTIVGFDGRRRGDPSRQLKPQKMENYCRTPEQMIELMNRYRDAALERGETTANSPPPPRP